MHVVRDASIVEGFAALLAYDPDATGEANAEAMAGLVVPRRRRRGDPGGARRDDARRARSARATGSGSRKHGVQSIAESVAVAACALLDAVVGDGHELVTVIEGEGATPANTRRITQWLAEEQPEVAVEVHHGGQPLYPYLFGVE